MLFLYLNDINPLNPKITYKIYSTWITADNYAPALLAKPYNDNYNVL